MAISHTAPGQPVDALPTGSSDSPERTSALFKSKDLEVMRLILKSGSSLPPHKVPGEITIHCLAGSISVTASGATHILRTGQLSFLLGNTVHDVVALEDTVALVTVAINK
ncbi:hypothetical protein BurJ1DRAFT_1825 [Burkholderiales bacterium JOSHI_001]|nr:hypothetical protein BurJ1DRAFT_1825 [Burkholderiales bacterium JOSHI_001]